ncbi:hypothetical protein HY933_00840 [Candidatus Falkowbacteria bacterium]|nr:hypothetical protein [Candidatus Falkowbacteria bacterium]
MPNHIHGIITITDKVVETQHAASLTDKAETQHAASLPNGLRTLQWGPNKFGPLQPGALPTIVRSFKSAVTKFVGQKYSRERFAWQARYYDVIIESEKNYQRIIQYILDNPGKWPADQNNPVNIKN